MKSTNSRQAVLNSLLAYDRPADVLRMALGQYEWGCPEPLVVLTRERVVSVLQRFLRGELSADAVEAWADLVELREDIDLPDEQVVDAIFVLANPTINSALDNQSANRLIASMSN
jgi:hypothetical protein